MDNLTGKNIHVSQPEQFCRYIHRYCNQTRLDGYDYCIRHILEDKSAPFRQCMYVNQPNKKRCTNAAPKADKIERRMDNVLCPFHAKRSVIKPRAQHSKKKATPDTPATMLKKLENYCKDPVHDPSYNPGAGHRVKAVTVVNEISRPSTVDQLEKSIKNNREPLLSKAHIEPIDDDFCHTDKTSLLDHAGVYTPKEICSITRDKILRLQHLYCMELSVLHQKFKEARRKYLLKVQNPEEPQSPKLVYRDLKDLRGRIVAKIEKPTISEPESPTTSWAERKALVSLKRYHRRSGVERVLRHQVLEQRSGHTKPPKPVCCFEKNGLKCIEPAMVAANYCKTHILTDPNQVLYAPCSGASNCTKPVLAIGDNPTCDLHFTFSASTQQPASKEVIQQPVEVESIPSTSAMETHVEDGSSTPDLLLDPEHFQAMDDIASLGLDEIGPGLLFGLDPFGEPGESSNAVLSSDLMQIQTIPLNPPQDILSDSQNLNEN